MNFVKMHFFAFLKFFVKVLFIKLVYFCRVKCHFIFGNKNIYENKMRKIGKIPKTDRWIPHEFNSRQMENRKNTCDNLFTRYKCKSFLHRIVTEDEKWIYFENPKRKKPWIDPVAPSTSTARPNCFGRKTILCAW